MGGAPTSQMQTLLSHYKFAFTADGRSLGALRQPASGGMTRFPLANIPGFVGQAHRGASPAESLDVERFRLAFGFKALECAIDNGQGGIRLLSGKNQRRMDADSRCVTHDDQTVGETGLKELNAPLLR